ncbi:hypothetical protein [Campylobacter sp. US33a]|uniref:Uncharacterized protein n=1 Tax=Campylobacter sp. CCS1377 TaxID=3158229 RepID=A0AAU7EAU6_9BACT|nr:hypothetical protein [Campylobacter sp. US33a]MCW1360061.1 hypothetical protein [Campylobacter jejuni]TEY02358.1 hypothetical protein ELQ16_05645 [Campylobacter sp. US33a]
MYEKKDLRVLQIIQKAREFSDPDLLNENLLAQLVNTPLKPIKNKNKQKIIQSLNELIKAKEKALLSNK